MRIICAFIGIALFSIQSCADNYLNQKLSYGSFLKKGGIEFKIHAPSSNQVQLIIFDNPEDKSGAAYEMSPDGNGDWTVFVNGLGVGTIYGYRLSGPANEDSVIIADPYSKAAITQNTWRHVAKTLVVDESFDWQGDTWENFDPLDLIIYEAHIRDMTIHPSSEANYPGTYKGFIENDQNGGIVHLKRMGVNAIQFLPIWDYANIEIPYKERADGMFNDWNPYERNHWGYMPTFFMAPESYYASDGNRNIGSWNGKDGRAVKEFKELVRELHKNDIAVILDVVINHVSNYDWHPLKFIDRDLYFQLDEKGNYVSQCCGNLLDLDNKHVQQYIIESLQYWMLEYHIDGFRFDQAHLLSLETAELISNELRSINPAVIIYGEAWDNRSEELSKIEWGSFNAHFRDVIRGDLHNFEQKGFLFGSYRPKEDKSDLKSIIAGTSKISGGVYKRPHHAINFLEVHDDYCFSDFLRLSSGENKKDDLITDKLSHISLSPKLKSMNKLAAFILFTSQGIPLFHQGQEWGHSKIIAETRVPDLNVHKMDPNSYNKDNETNWVNWNELSQNQDLVDFYKALIQIRKEYPQLRKIRPQDISFYNFKNEFSLGYSFNETMIAYINGDNEEELDITLLDGKWNLLISTSDQTNNELSNGKITLGPKSGVLLIRE